MQCCNCSSPEDLHLHYIIPLDKGGNDIPSNRVQVCGTCLQLLHPSLSSLIKKGLDKTEKKIGRPQVSSDRLERAITLYRETNTPVHEIIKQTGISQGSLYRYLNENGLKRLK